MKKLKCALCCLLLVTILFACSSKEEPIDFWHATALAIQPKLTSNQYDEGNWQIGVQDKSMMKDEKHPNMTIRQVFKEDTIENIVMFSLQNKNDKKTVSYIYKKHTIEEDKEFDETLKIVSSDETYKNYTMEYIIQNFKYGNYINADEANGTLKIDDKHNVTFDNMPLLKEAMPSWLSLINDIQSEFSIDYKAYDFVNLPELAKDITIEKMDTISAEQATTIKFYSEPRYNAKGYTIVMFLEVEKDMSEANYKDYTVEQQGYSGNAGGTLEKRGVENLYNIAVQMDLEIKYALYVQDETAYLYEQSMRDADILNDIQNQNASLAKKVLKTTNNSYVRK